MVVILSLQATPSNADCASDCKSALTAADRLIADLKKTIDLQHQIVTSQQNSIVTLTLQNEEKGEALASPLRNPFITITAGLLTGALLVLVLDKNR